MFYLELLKLASPEIVVVVTALAVLAIGLASERASGICSFVAALGLALAIGAVLMLPRNATLFHGMLVISPLNSLFKIICLALAFFTVLQAHAKNSLRNQFYLRHVWNNRAHRNWTKTHERIRATAPLRGHRHDSRRVRLQNRRRAISSLGARRLPGRACAFRGVHRVGFEGGVVRRPRKNRACRVRSGAWQCRMARHDRRLGAGACPARRIVNRHWQSRCTCSVQCPPFAGLLRRRPRWLHTSWTRRRRARWIQCDVVLHDSLCLHAGRRIWRRRVGPTRNRRRRFTELYQALVAFTIARRVHVDLHAVAGRPTAARWIFRKVLPV